MIQFLERTVVLACVGVAAEVVFTAFLEPRNDNRLVGFSYVWMFPVYGLLYPGYSLLHPRIADWPWVFRAEVYAIAIMVFELITGLLLRALLGEAPWEPQYRGKPRTIMGLVRLDYFPAWAAGALVFERAFRVVAGL